MKSAIASNLARLGCILGLGSGLASAAQSDFGASFSVSQGVAAQSMIQSVGDTTNSIVNLIMGPGMFVVMAIGALLALFGWAAPHPRAREPRQRPAGDQAAGAGTGAGVEAIRDARSVNAETARWLETRGFLLEDHPGPDGEPRACVLYRSATQERTLELEGFRTAVIPGAQVLEVAHREDLLLLTESGVAIEVPAAFLEARRAALLAQARAAHPDAEAAVLEAIASARLAEDDPRLCFDAIEGMALIQHEVFFSDFIRELEAWRDPSQSRPIAARLSAYHGSGALAGFFDGETQFRLDEKRLATFELQELSSAGEHLVAAVVGTLLQMLLLHCQGEHLAGGGPRAYRKYIVLDEFWALLGVPMVADLVVTGLRT